MNAADQEIISLLRAVLDRIEQKIDEPVEQPEPPPLPLDDQLWDVTEVGRYLHRTPKVVREMYSCLLSFPKAIRLPSKGNARPLYIAAEVIAWAKKFKEKN